MFLVSMVLLPQLLYADAKSDISAFVTRFYTTCLNRQPDAGGLNSWVSGLLTGRLTGAQVADGFIFSDELLSKNLSDNEFLNILYLAFFNRQPDAAGLSNWINAIARGANRRYVLNGFVNSTEFKILCDSYGIRPGFPVSSNSGSFADTSNEAVLVAAVENKLFGTVNAVRLQYGIGQLSINPALSDIARSRCADMINGNYFSHTTPDGKNIFIMLNESGFAWQFAGENIYQCSPGSSGSESAILNTWMASPLHKDNILNGAFHQIGIGIVDSGNTRTVSVIFSN